jgi:peroxiredoxin
MTRNTIAAFVLDAAVLFPLAMLLRTPQAPAVAFPLLEGRTLDSAALHGKVVLVNFWATSCAICLKEMPQLANTHRRYAGRGLETVAVAMSYDRPDLVAAYVREQALPLRVAFDPDGAIAKAYEDARLTPTLFVLDRRGRIVRRYAGVPDFPGLHALIEKLLAQS